MKYLVLAMTLFSSMALASLNKEEACEVKKEMRVKIDVAALNLANARNPEDGFVRHEMDEVITASKAIEEAQKICP